MFTEHCSDFNIKETLRESDSYAIHASVPNSCLDSLSLSTQFASRSLFLHSSVLDSPTRFFLVLLCQSLTHTNHTCCRLWWICLLKKIFRKKKKPLLDKFAAWLLKRISFFGKTVCWWPTTSCVHLRPDVIHEHFSHLQFLVSIRSLGKVGTRRTLNQAMNPLQHSCFAAQLLNTQLKVGSRSKNLCSPSQKLTRPYQIGRINYRFHCLARLRMQKFIDVIILKLRRKNTP